MNYTQVTNPRWANAEQNAIECDVVFEHTGPNPVPFGANPNDQYEHAREIFFRCVNGDFGPIAAFIPPPAPEAPDTSQPTVIGADEL